MNEQKLAACFCRDVDLILRGERRAQIKGPAPDEYRKAVELARTLAETDFGDECGIRQELRRRLLDRFKTKRNYAQLDDEELEKVAGGVGKGQNSCSLCNCTLSGSAIEGDTCPICRHPRECHS